MRWVLWLVPALLATQETEMVKINSKPAWIKKNKKILKTSWEPFSTKKPGMVFRLVIPAIRMMESERITVWVQSGQKQKVNESYQLISWCNSTRLQSQVCRRRKQVNQSPRTAPLLPLNLWGAALIGRAKTFPGIKRCGCIVPRKGLFVSVCFILSLIPEGI